MGRTTRQAVGRFVLRAIASLGLAVQDREPLKTVPTVPQPLKGLPVHPLAIFRDPLAAGVVAD